MAGDKELRVKLTAEADTSEVKEFGEELDKVEERPPVEVDMRVDIDDAALAKAKTSIDEVGKSAGSSKSVLANMVGNATQDLGALSGVAGSAGVAIGQMAEYMSDAASAGEGIGSIAGNFAKVIGPVAAISLGVGLLSTVFGNMAKDAEEARKRAEEFNKAIKETGGSVAGAFAKLAEAGNFDALIDDLDRLNISFEQFVELASGGAVPIDPVRADVLARVEKLTELYQDGSINSGKYFKQVAKLGAEMGVTGDEALAMARSLEEVTGTAKDSGEAIQGAVEQYAAQRRVMQDNADLIDVVNEAVKRGIDVTDQSTEALVRLMGQQDLQVAQQAALNEAIAAGNEEMKAWAEEAAAQAADEAARLRGELEGVNAQFAEMTGAILSTAEARVAAVAAEQQYLELQKEGKATTDELVVAAINLAEAHAAQEEAQALANGETSNATTKQASLIESLKATAAQAKGPTKAAILETVAALERVPPAVNTTMTVNNAEALRKLNEQLRLMAIIRATSDATVAALKAVPGGAGGAILGQAAPITQNITVNAGFGTDAFAVRSAVLSSARQAARLTQNAVKFVR